MAICIIGAILLGFTWLALRGMSAEEKRRRTLPRTDVDAGTPIPPQSGHTGQARP